MIGVGGLPAEPKAVLSFSISHGRMHGCDSGSPGSSDRIREQRQHESGYETE